MTGPDCNLPPRGRGSQTPGVVGRPVACGPVDVVVVAVRTTVTAAELVADELFALGASAVGEQAVAGEVDGTSAGGADGTVELVADLPAAALADLRHPYRVVDVAPDVADGWRAHATAVVAGRFVLRPVWCDAPSVPGSPDGPPVEVLLDPGASFGTGSHPTTRMCVALLDHPVVRSVIATGGPDDVLDVGCGSGVLAVAAALAGAASVTAIDIDPAARAATARAAELNDVIDRVRVVPDGLADLAAAVVDGSRGPFSLVLANVLVPVVESHAADLVGVAAPGAVLVVSGLLESQVERATTALRSAATGRGGAAPVEVVEVAADGEWRTVVFRLGHRAVNPL